MKNMNNPTYEPINENLDFPATKGDIKNLASKTDLGLLRHDINDKFTRLPTVEDFRQLLSTVDKFSRASEYIQYRAKRGSPPT